MRPVLQVVAGTQRLYMLIITDMRRHSHILKQMQAETEGFKSISLVSLAGSFSHLGNSFRK